MKSHVKLFLILCAAAILLCAVPLASAAEESPDDIRAYIEILRSDVNAEKVRILNEALRLTEEEAKVFWPIYRKYEVEVFALSDARIELTEKFFEFQSSAKQDPDKARLIAEKWLALKQDRLDLWKKYYHKISKALCPVRAAQFIQIEHEIALYIDFSLASEAPLLGSMEAPAAGGK